MIESRSSSITYNELMSNKTVANNESVDEFINSLDDKQQAEDSKKLVGIYQKITGLPPVMWGSSIIGFGKVSLTYASGRGVDWMKVGFSPRKGKISLYLTFDAASLTAKFPKLGKYKIAKGCIYINKLSDVEPDELDKLIAAAFENGYEQPKRADGKEQIVAQS